VVNKHEQNTISTHLYFISGLDIYGFQSIIKKDFRSAELIQADAYK